MQESAAPYHDWNQRITEECYATNSAARILNDEDLIVEIVNNYSKISFNFGPTLLSWLQDFYPRVYASILSADRRSQRRFSGHGAAIAQAYNHLIMPLANPRDQRTQVIWGIRDFEQRFGRRPEGMWLPETAVDLATLEALAEQDVQFTLLAPHQARRIRRLKDTNLSPADELNQDAEEKKESEWVEVGESNIDTRRAYLQRLPSGRQIAIFFYDGPISRSIAFEHLLNHGDQFADRLLEGFSHDSAHPQLVHIATDGETYGHHHRHGEMALAFALRRLERDQTVRLCNYGEFLEKYPPRWQVEIFERTSWSCAHGVGRWERDCGCRTGGEPSWDQAWRGPLRDALNWLRDAVNPLFEKHAASVLSDPWAARDAYIDIINDREPENIERFFKAHAHHPLDQAESTRALKLMELQRHAMLMYTSCGWFFSELSGIETLQVIEYAGRVLQLAEELFNAPLREPFLARLQKAKSNLKQSKNGRELFEQHIPSPPIGLRQVGAHFAISALFDRANDKTSTIYAFQVKDKSRQFYETGEVRLLIGHCHISSRITAESGEFIYAALHLGGHNVTGGIRPYAGGAPLRALTKAAEELFQRAETPALIRLIDKSFKEESFSLRSLFRDEQHQIMERILGTAIRDAETAYLQVYRRRAPLLRFLADLEVPQPHSLRVAAEIVLNRQLKEAFTAAPPDLERLQSLLAEIDVGHISLEEENLAFVAAERLISLARRLASEPYKLEALEDCNRAAQMAERLPFEVNLWEAQNICYEILHSAYPKQKWLAERSDEPEVDIWVMRFEALARALKVALD